MRFTDRSRTVLDWECPQARFWSYEYDGLGLEPVEPNEDLEFGKAIADSVQDLRQGEPPIWVSPDPKVRLDLSVLHEGLHQAYKHSIWPLWVDQYELIATELECVWPLSSDVLYMARPDAVLKRRSDKSYWYLEDKTTSQNADNFLKQWDKAVQLHATALCIERALNVQVSGCFVQGWYKGYKKANTIYSPLCYGWCRDGTPGLTHTQWSPTYRAGWERRRVDQYNGGVAAWVKSLPASLVQEQFPLAGPIMVRRDLVEEYFQQTLNRELEIASGQASFPKHFSDCDEFSKYRRPCQFKECCWAPSIGRDPIASGLYRKRQPHHEPGVRACSTTHL